MANNKFFCETFLKSGNSYAKKRDLENLLLYKKKGRRFGLRAVLGAS